MAIQFHPVSSKIIFLCLFVLAVQLKISVAAEENVGHRYKRGPPEMVPCDQKYIDACTAVACSPSDNNKCSQAGTMATGATGIPFCACSMAIDATVATDKKCVKIDASTATAPTGATDVSTGACAQKCTEVTAGRKAPYSAYFCTSPTVCTCVPDSPTGVQGEQLTDTVVEIIRGLVQAIIDFLLAVVQAIKDLAAALLNLNLGGLLSGLAETLSGVLGGGKGDD